MPPIKVEMTVGQTTVSMPDVEPGLSMSMTNNDREDPHVVIVSCNWADDGGVVYRQNISSTQEFLNRHFRVVQPQGLEVVARLGTSEAIGLPITTKFGAATLSLIHVTAE